MAYGCGVAADPLRSIDLLTLLLISCLCGRRLLNHLDERTIQIQLLAVRAGLCRLSNLVFEERNAKVAYRLTRPLEIFVRQPDSKVIGGQHGHALQQDHQGPVSFFASPSPS